MKCLPRRTAKLSIDMTSVHSFAFAYTYQTFPPKKKEEIWNLIDGALGLDTKKKEVQSHSILHGIGGDDGGVVSGGVGGETVGEEADADVPLDDHVAGAGDPPPDPGDPDPALPVILLDLEPFRHGPVFPRRPTYLPNPPQRRSHLSTYGAR